MLKNDARIEPLLGQYYYILNCPAPTVQYSTVLKSIYSIVLYILYPGTVVLVLLYCTAQWAGTSILPCS